MKKKRALLIAALLVVVGAAATCAILLRDKEDEDFMPNYSAFSGDAAANVYRLEDDARYILSYENVTTQNLEDFEIYLEGGGFSATSVNEYNDNMFTMAYNNKSRANAFVCVHDKSADMLWVAYDADSLIGAGCENCNAKGGISCESCAGQGKKTHQKCNGSGREVCYNCYGGGTKRGDTEAGFAPCPNCKGQGIADCYCDNGYLDCIDCENGVIGCEVCKGKGVNPIKITEYIAGYDIGNEDLNLRFE